jgi:hypothetical protein
MKTFIDAQCPGGFVTAFCTYSLVLLTMALVDRHSHYLFLV